MILITQLKYLILKVRYKVTSQKSDVISCFQDMLVKLSTFGITTQVQVTGWCGHGIETFDSRM